MRPVADPDGQDRQQRPADGEAQQHNTSQHVGSGRDERGVTSATATTSRGAEARVLGDRDVVRVMAIAADVQELVPSRNGDRGTGDRRRPQLVAYQTVDRRQVDRRIAIGGSRLGGPEDSAGGENKNPGQPADPPRATRRGTSVVGI